jgi:hypothetical protein
LQEQALKRVAVAVTRDAFHQDLIVLGFFQMNGQWSDSAHS